MKPSSHIANLQYDPLSQNLDVTFKNGQVYRYHGVPAKVHAEMDEAESAGTFLHARIKPNYPSKLLPKP